MQEYLTYFPITMLCQIMAHSLIVQPPPLFQFPAHKTVKLNIFCKYLFINTFASQFFVTQKRPIFASIHENHQNKQ